LARQLAGFLGERRSRGARPLRLEALELLGEGALAGGEGPQLLEHRLTARADQREQPLRLAVQPLLIARQPRELLHGFGEPAPRLARCLLRAGRRARLAAAQRFGHSLLALRQRGRLGQRAVERRERLRAPLLGERVPLAAQLVGHVLELLLGLLTGLLRLARLPVVRRPRGALHGGARVARGLRGPRQGWPGRAEILRDLVD